tara:strand:+ start:442 stop:906 length:465 start_codon:yes stop_codon:yes gene_type:complete
MPIISLNRPEAKQNNSPATPTPTTNKYVLLTPRSKPYINSAAVEDFFRTFPNLPSKSNGPHKQSGVSLFIRDRANGLNKYTKKLDLKSKHKESTEEDFENYFSDSISLYLFKEKGKFPPEEINEFDLSPGDFKDNPPTSVDLNEMGMDINDFNF